MLSLYLQAISDENDRLKFKQIYCDYKDIMFKKAYSILKSKELAEDAVHNAFIKIIKYLPKIYNPQDEKTKWYVIVVAENEAKKIYNREHKIVQIEFKDMESNFVLEDIIESIIEVETIKNMIAELPDIYKAPMSLKYYNELSVKEIAAVLSMSTHTVYKRLERGKIILLKLLKENEIND